MAKEVIAEIIGNSQELSAELIRDFIARQFKVSVQDMQSRSRKKTIAFPRQVSMYLARKYTEQGLAEIGKAFNRDHSTVLHSVRVISGAISRNGSIRGQVEVAGQEAEEINFGKDGQAGFRSQNRKTTMFASRKQFIA